MKLSINRIVYHTIVSWLYRARSRQHSFRGGYLPSPMFTCRVYLSRNNQLWIDISILFCQQEAKGFNGLIPTLVWNSTMLNFNRGMKNKSSRMKEFDMKSRSIDWSISKTRRNTHRGINCVYEQFDGKMDIHLFISSISDKAALNRATKFIYYFQKAMKKRTEIDTLHAV